MHHLRCIILVSVVAWFGSAAPARAAGWGAPPSPEAAPGSTPAPSAMPPAVVVPSPPVSTAAGAPPAASASPTVGVTPPELLRGADAAIAGGDLTSARILFERLLREAPTSPQAFEARRALRLIELGERTRSAASVDGASSVTETPNIAPTPSNRQPVTVRQEAYSLKTSEQLRLTAWEKLDFGATAFLYGMTLGTAFTLGVSSPTVADVTTPIVLGASAYALSAVAYLQVAKPDRGDLPLLLGVTFYIPVTTQLIGRFAVDRPNEKKIAIATVGTALISIPLGIALTQKLDLDPGDTQLVRDAGFWGLALGLTGVMGFGGGAYHTEPSARTLSGVGLLGLVGGLGLGAVAAANSEISLERIRVATWGGYAGAVLGALIGAGMYEHNEDYGVSRGITFGALAGLVVTFATTGGLDRIPPSETPGRHAASRAVQWTPTIAPLAGANGQPVPALGVAGVL